MCANIFADADVIVNLRTYLLSAYADDIVLLAPLRHSLQVLISALKKYCSTLDLTCNTISLFSWFYNRNAKKRQFVNEIRYM